MLTMTATFKDHFSAASSAYAKYRPTYPTRLVHYLEEIAPNNSLIWDVGCGTGQLSEQLPLCFKKVIATDASSQQIAKTVANPKINYYCAPAENSKIDDHTVDIVIAAQAAHWFDHPLFFKEVKRVLKPNGIVVLATYNLMCIDEIDNTPIIEFYQNTLKDYWPPERRLVEEAYQSIDFPFQEITAPKMEMNETWSIEAVKGYIKTWSAVKKLEQKEGIEPINKLFDKLSLEWGSKDEKRLITWPLTLRVGQL